MVYKRGGVWWYQIKRGGQRIRRSTGTGNKVAARNIEAAHRVALAQGDVGIAARATPPVYSEYVTRFLAMVAVRNGDKPRTVAYYRDRTNKLLEFAPLARARLDQIDAAMIESFIVWRRKRTGVTGTNRCLQVLRRQLRIAAEWGLISKAPKIGLLGGERRRDFVLGRDQEAAYLAACPEYLARIALLIVDTGLRIGEALALRWPDLDLDAGRHGYVKVCAGKTPSARRGVPLTARVRAMLDAMPRSSGPIFGQSLTSSVAHAHLRIRKRLKLPSDFVLHSLRHTYLSRLGEAGVDAFTLMRLAGHSTITISQRYVHPSQDATDAAAARLENLLGAATAGATGGPHDRIGKAKPRVSNVNKR